MICFDHLPVLGVTQGHLGGPADAAAAVGSPFNKPNTGGTTTWTVAAAAAPPADVGAAHAEVHAAVLARQGDFQLRCRLDAV